jgi:MoaA/NifB/PqqE/SkfB family radical SAM enzyme
MIHTKRDRFIGLVLKGLCTAASVVFYGNRRNADWIYEKMKRPRTYGYAAMNVLFFAAKRPRMFRVISLIVEPVFGCNLSCSYCWHSISHYFEHKSKRPRLMPMDLFRTIVDQAPESVESLAFALIGEPLLHPEIGSMIAYAKKKGLRTVLYTNGTLLTGKTMETIARSGLDVLVVSVEPDEANTLKHRGVSLSLLRERIRAFHAVKPDTMELKLSVVVHPDNRPAVDALAHTFQGLVRHIKLSPLIRYTGTRPTGHCIEPWRGSLSILTSGDVSPCCVSAGYRSITVGNLYESALPDIIHGPGLTQTLEDFINGKRPDVCHRCRTFKAKHIPLRVPTLPKPATKSRTR